METNRPVVFPETWTHVAGTYDSSQGRAAIFINGELANSEPGSGLLSQVIYFVLFIILREISNEFFLRGSVPDCETIKMLIIFLH